MTKPSEVYTINVLDDEEFDRLPVGKPREALGMTDKVRKIAWVRRTGIPEWDEETIKHEFDELMADVSPHEVDGIRYKSVGRIVGDIFGLGIPTGIRALNRSRDRKIVKAEKAEADKQQQALAAQEKINNDFLAQLRGFQTSNATQAFGPAQQNPLSEGDFQTGLSNLDLNAQRTQSDVFKRFRGLGTQQQNSAFSNAANRATESSAQARSSFIGDQEERKRLAAAA